MLLLLRTTLMYPLDSEMVSSGDILSITNKVWKNKTKRRCIFSFSLLPEVKISLQQRKVFPHGRLYLWSIFFGTSRGSHFGNRPSRPSTPCKIHPFDPPLLNIAKISNNHKIKKIYILFRVFSSKELFVKVSASWLKIFRQGRIKSSWGRAWPGRMIKY